MFNARTRIFRSACLLAVSAIGFALAAASFAQQRERAPAAVGQAETPVLNPRHPERYTVQRGDTLWDIAAMFLRDPWYWPEIWQINPQVDNPHLIYPGDVLSLAFVDGRPVLQLERSGGGRVERLSPRIRTEPLEEAIPTIPFETVRAFLSRPAVLSAEEIEELPYVFRHPDGLMGSAGEDVYVRGADDSPVGTVFNVVNLGDALVDPDDDSVLGYEAVYAGQGRVRRDGDPATLLLTDSAREVIVGDYLVSEESVTPMNFVPRSPETDVEGRIISVIDGISLIGQYQVIALNVGGEDGLEPGHVLRVFQTGELVTDDLARRRGLPKKVRLPDEPAGTIMVFRIFDRMSYALVMEATRAIAVLDTVRNP